MDCLIQIPDSQIFSPFETRRDLLHLKTINLLVDFEEPLIHSCNKGAVALGGLRGSVMAGRDVVLLLGDSVGDVNMADGMAVSTVLKIGYLNFDADTRLDEYMQLYDIVIINDGSLDVAHQIVSVMM